MLNSSNQLLLIQRRKPGLEPYWTTPGGGVESTDTSLEAAFTRELQEELGATAEVVRNVFFHSKKCANSYHVEYYFLSRLIKIDVSKRDGPEFSDPGRGEYIVEAVDIRHLSKLDLRPHEVRDFLQLNYEALIEEAQYQ